MLVPLKSLSELLRYPGRPVESVSLVWEGEELRHVRSGGCAFPVAAGQPVLIDFTQSVAPEAWFARARENVSLLGTRANRARMIKGAVVGSRRISRQNLRRFAALLPRQPFVLMVGAGTVGAGCEPLYEDPDVRQIGFDIYPSTWTQLVADAHQIPIAGSSVDGVVIQAVLEHVVDPATVVAEVHRVLKPGGLVYAETPFMQPVHEGAYDFTRFTELGHRWLWRDFEEIARDVIGGPGLSLYWAARYFARALLVRRPIADVVSAPCLAACLIDRVLPLKRRIEAATGACFLGRKSVCPLSLRDIVPQYLGPPSEAH